MWTRSSSCVDTLHALHALLFVYSFPCYSSCDSLAVLPWTVSCTGHHWQSSGCIYALARCTPALTSSLSQCHWRVASIAAFAGWALQWRASMLSFHDRHTLHTFRGRRTRHSLHTRHTSLATYPIRHNAQASVRSLLTEFFRRLMLAVVNKTPYHCVFSFQFSPRKENCSPLSAFKCYSIARWAWSAFFSAESTQRLAIPLLPRPLPFL